MFEDCFWQIFSNLLSSQSAKLFPSLSLNLNFCENIFSRKLLIEVSKWEIIFFWVDIRLSRCDKKLEILPCSRSGGKYKAIELRTSWPTLNLVLPPDFVVILSLAESVFKRLLKKIGSYLPIFLPLITKPPNVAFFCSSR